MDTKTEVRDFLTSRRAKITPAEAGLTTYGTRQVPGRSNLPSHSSGALDV